MKPVKSPYAKRQLLVCFNSRDPSTGKPSCGMNGSAALRDYLKKTVKERGLKGEVIVTGTGCLDICPAHGCAVAFQPEGEFFLSDTTEEAGEELIRYLTR